MESRMSMPRVQKSMVFFCRREGGWGLILGVEWV